MKNPKASKLSEIRQTQKTNTIYHEGTKNTPMQVTENGTVVSRAEGREK